jgi:hypothetical protein
LELEDALGHVGCLRLKLTALALGLVSVGQRAVCLDVSLLF